MVPLKSPYGSMEGCDLCSVAATANAGPDFPRSELETLAIKMAAWPFPGREHESHLRV